MALLPIFEVRRINYMPSKKIIIPTLLVMLFGGWWYFSEFVQQKTKQPTPVLTGTTAEETLALDTDGDGLKDWEELLWKTDQKNPDTDGDGTTDNEEILAKRDPRKPWPNDEITLPSPDATDGTATAMADDGENITAKLAQNFAAAYFSRKMASGPNGNTPLEKDDLSNQVFSDIARTITQEGVIDNTPRFSAKDFRIFAFTSDNDARTYIDALGDIFKSADFPQKSDIEAISDAIAKQEKGLEGVKDLELYRDGYKKLAEAMQTLSVPQSFLETHIAMANNFWRLGLYLEEFIAMETDPIKGMIALNGYSKEGMQSIELLKKIVGEIKTKHFSFSQEEGGSEFNKYLNI